MLRVVEALRPTWVVGENVAGLVSMVQSVQKLGVEGRSINRFEGEDHYEAVWSRQETMLLVALLQDLERLGYDVQAFVIPACAVSAAHRRDRVALVAHAESTRSQVSNRMREQKFDRPDGCGADVANAQRNRRGADGNSPGDDEKRDSPAPEQGGRTELCAVGRGGITVSNTDQVRCKVMEPRSRPAERKVFGGFGEDRTVSAGGRSTQPRVGGVADGVPAWMDGYWLTEPDIPRVATGIPDRVEQLKAYGNAVYWRQFYPIFKGIYTIENNYRSTCK